MGVPVREEPCDSVLGLHACSAQEDLHSGHTLFFSFPHGIVKKHRMRKEHVNPSPARLLQSQVPNPLHAWRYHFPWSTPYANPKHFQHRHTSLLSFKSIMGIIREVTIDQVILKHWIFSCRQSVQGEEPLQIRLQRNIIMQNHLASAEAFPQGEVLRIELEGKNQFLVVAIGCKTPFLKCTPLKELQSQGQGRKGDSWVVTKPGLSLGTPMQVQLSDQTPVL